MNFDNKTLIYVFLSFTSITCVHGFIIINSAKDISDPNADIYLNSQQLINKYNYSSEKHTVLTKDHYLLNLFRIPNKGPPALLVHGIGDSSDSWLVLGPENSLAYLLSDAGFDVWLFNARGNTYSKGHRRKLSHKQYWNFSYEEMGTQDLTATIDHILRVTSRNKLFYVGFSQGTTIFCVMCSLKPEYNEKIELAILLAPVAWLKTTQYPFIEVLAENLDKVVLLTEFIGLYEVFSSNPIRNLYHAKVCRDGVPEKVLCDIEYYINYGLRNTNNLLLEKLPVITSHIPAGTSSKTFLHFLQGYKSKRFQRFDYGEQQNLLTYLSPQPPEYDVSLVKAPITMIVSESDWFSKVDDVNNLKSRLPAVVKYIQLNKSMDFSHIEFLYGSRVKTLINLPVVEMLVNIVSPNSS